MKTSNLFRVVLVATSVTFAVACQKSNSSSTSPTSSNDVQTAADDNTMVSQQSDATSDDAVTAMNGNASVAGASISGTKSGASTLGINVTLKSLCGATITYDTVNENKVLTITYTGDDCWGRFTRTGTITVSIPLGTQWKDQGAVATINVNALTITRKRDGKAIVINGSRTITNTSGGLLVDLATTDSIVHDFTSSWSITFPNGKVRSWTATKHRVFTYSNGLVETTTGSETGTNRFGVGFQLWITQPKVIVQSCDFNLSAGQDSITRTDNITSVVTYGLNSTGGAQASCPLPSGYYYAELVWSNGNNGKQYTYIYPY